jgi:hypothetical protein
MFRIKRCYDQMKNKTCLYTRRIHTYAFSRAKCIFYVFNHELRDKHRMAIARIIRHRLCCRELPKENWSSQYANMRLDCESFALVKRDIYLPSYLQMMSNRIAREKPFLLSLADNIVLIIVSRNEILQHHNFLLIVSIKDAVAFNRN